MLRSYESSPDQVPELDSIHNYYERRVFEILQKKLPELSGSNIDIADIACVALNHLPPCYIRHDVDMAFYLSSTDRQEMETKVEQVVEDAINTVDKNKERYDGEA